MAIGPIVAQYFAPSPKCEPGKRKRKSRRSLDSSPWTFALQRCSNPSLRCLDISRWGLLTSVHPLGNGNGHPAIGTDVSVLIKVVDQSTIMAIRWALPPPWPKIRTTYIPIFESPGTFMEVEGARIRRLWHMFVDFMTLQERSQTLPRLKLT